MSLSRVYLRPVGRVTPPPTRPIGHPERFVRVAGRADLTFSAFELVERHQDGWVERRIVTLGDLDAALGHGRLPLEQLRDQLERMAAPRGEIAGLSLDRTRVMGIVNVTPDSFSDGGRYLTPRAAIEHALELESEGADILDIGGESTRPGAEPVPLDEEIRRVIPVIEGLAGRTRARISVDTRKGEVMRQAARAGAHILNDISGLTADPVSRRLAAETGLPVILMHSRGDPSTMQRDPRYGDVVLDVMDELEERVEACVRAGIPRNRLIVDPGIGFAKTAAHNVALLSSLAMLHGLGTALLLGASRKSFIGTITGAVDPDDRLPGSLAAAMVGVMAGVQILRVHDVAATRQALGILEASLAGAVPGLAGR